MSDLAGKGGVIEDFFDRLQFGKMVPAADGSQGNVVPAGIETECQPPLVEIAVKWLIKVFEFFYPFIFFDFFLFNTS